MTLITYEYHVDIFTVGLCLAHVNSTFSSRFFFCVSKTLGLVLVQAAC